MSVGNNSKEPLSDDRFFFVATRIFDLVGLIVKSVTLVTISYFILQALEALAGKTTITNIFLAYITAEESDYGLPWLLTVSFAVWAYLERRLRKRKTEHFHSHNKEIETKIHPDRTSSGLLNSGDTNPRDR